MLLSDLIDQTGIDVLDHLDRQASIPVVTGPQAQGDVFVLPVSPQSEELVTAASVGNVGGPVPTSGVPVVRGENGGNTHSLHGDGTCYWNPGGSVSGSSLALGTLTVEPDAVAYLAHPEHGYMGIGPGMYELRRQREQADEIRMVAD